MTSVAAPRGCPNCAVTFCFFEETPVGCSRVTMRVVVFRPLGWKRVHCAVATRAHVPSSVSPTLPVSQGGVPEAESTRMDENDKAPRRGASRSGGPGRAWSRSSKKVSKPEMAVTPKGAVTPSRSEKSGRGVVRAGPHLLGRRDDQHVQGTDRGPWAERWPRGLTGVGAKGPAGHREG